MAASVLGPSAPENPVEYSRPLEIEASELQRVWTKTRHNGPNKRSSSYKKISVLTLSWRPDIDDLGSQLQDEVNRLSDTFRNEFNYPVTNYQIGPNRPQSAVNYKVAKFVHKNSGPGHLLVIYYAGHGRPGEAHGELYMIRKPPQGSTTNEKRRVWNERVIWNKTESLLCGTEETDMLVIFDCCSAGDLYFKRGPDRSFEYLGATEAGQATELPGSTSFTSALDDSLKSLLKRKGCFTSSELAKEIDRQPGFPLHQHPVLYDRDQDMYTGRIMLHPMPEAGNTQEESLTIITPPVPTLGKVLTLHFEFIADPLATDIELIAQHFNDANLERHIGIDQIRWGAIRPRLFLQAVQNFKDAGRRGRALSNTSQLTPPRTTGWPTPEEGNLDATLTLETPTSALFPKDDEPRELRASSKRPRSLSISAAVSRSRKSRRIRDRVEGTSPNAGAGSESPA